MRVDDLGHPLGEKVSGALILGVVEGGYPGGEIVGRRSGRRSDHSHPVDPRVRGRARNRLRQHGDVVTVRGERLGEPMDVPAQAAVNQRRVLPGHHQHAHRHERTSTPGAPMEF
jgi:hypothetical protein